MKPNPLDRFLRGVLAPVLFLMPGVLLASGALKDGETVYRHVCISCHGPGPIEAPKYGDPRAWQPLIAEGQHIVTAHGWVGVREMPPRGGEPKLTLEEFAGAVAYMARAAGADWPDPSTAPEIMTAIRMEETARIEALRTATQDHPDRGLSGQRVYEQICLHCHQTGVAGAPRFKNRGDWKPLIREGQHVLTAHAWVGVRAMPPRGGHPELSLEEFSRAVVFMANAAGAKWKDPTSDAKLLGKIREEVVKRKLALKTN